jgi:hypothetical protein
MWQHNQNLELCVTRSRYTVVLQQLAGDLVYVYVVFFYISSFLCMYHELKKQLDEKLMGQKSLPQLQKFPRMSSRCPRIILQNGVASFTDELS